MKEGSAYFSHDYNARNDRKMVKLKVHHKMAGLGIYWSLIEMIYEEGGKLLLGDIYIIADELRSDPEVVESIIKDFDLFQVNEKYFWSQSALDRLELRKEKSQRAASSALKRWETKQTDANALRTHCDSNAIKESKVKEKKDDDEREETPSTPLIFQSTLINTSTAENLLVFSGEFGLLATRQTGKSVTQLETLSAEFLNEQSAVGKLSWPNTPDLRRHFIAWVKKKPVTAGGVYIGPVKKVINHNPQSNGNSIHQ